jgi:two-component system, NarL family, sensor histidine kinase DegS
VPEHRLAVPPGDASESEASLDALVEVYERERAALAGQLHDGPVQTLTAASLRLQSAAHFGELTPELAHEVVTSIGEAAIQLRQLMSALGSWWVPGGDLDEAVERYVLQACGQRGVEPTLELDPLLRPTPRHGATIFRIVQEAVENALRHSGTARLVIRLSGGATEVVLEVRDFGSGFDPELLAADEHVGLELMRRRAESVGGALTVTTSIGAGTAVRAVIPVAR